MLAPLFTQFIGRVTVPWALAPPPRFSREAKRRHDQRPLPQEETTEQNSLLFRKTWSPTLVTCFPLPPAQVSAFHSRSPRVPVGPAGAQRTPWTVFTGQHTHKGLGTLGRTSGHAVSPGWGLILRDELYGQLAENRLGEGPLSLLASEEAIPARGKQTDGQNLSVGRGAGSLARDP